MRLLRPAVQNRLPLRCPSWPLEGEKKQVRVAIHQPSSFNLQPTLRLLCLFVAISCQLSTFNPQICLAATFTNNSLITESDATYDGQDIIVGNTTLTINGPHSFNSVLLTNNAVLTHSPCTTPRRISLISPELASGAGAVPSVLESTEWSL